MDSQNKMDDRLKKNILDLNYNKHLQYKTTSIIISFTYIAGVVIAWITNQLDLSSYIQMSIISIFSILILIPSIYVIITSSQHLTEISELLKNLKLK